MEPGFFPEMLVATAKNLTAGGRALASKLGWQSQADVTSANGVSPPQLSRAVWTASLAINFLALGLPMVILQVYDRILPNEALGTFSLLLMGLAVVLVLDATLKIARAHVVGWAAAQFEHRTSTEFVGRFLYASPSDIERTPPGVHLDRLQAIDTLREFYGGQSRLLLVDLPFLFIFLGLIFVIGGLVVLVPLAMIGVLAVVSLVAGNALKERLAQRAQLDDRRYSFIIEALAGIQTIKSMAMEPQMQRRYERLQATGAASAYKSIVLGNAVQTIGGIISNMTMILIVSVGALLVIGGSMSVGGLAACTLLGGRALQPLLRGMSVWTQMQSLDVARAQVADLQDMDLAPVREPQRLEDLQGGISFRDVTFSYTPDDKPLLDKFSLIVKPGEMLALTGPEGDGKSTLLKLIMGELQPQAGRVMIDGHDAAGESRDDLALDIAYVPPTATLFKGTILENLTMFHGGDAIDRAREAARMIGLEDDIHRLPQGYDTQVSQGISDELPGGMMQRIIIARSLARDAKVLLFDEANAGLDRKADTQLMAAIEELKGKITIIAVSHRPSLIRQADRVITIHKGRARLNHSFAPAKPETPVVPDTQQHEETAPAAEAVLAGGAA
ncbi:peptidase domain-containing ABC transporter [Pyruvatibacter sp.]|uniref:peptidase domain-containing ABC transporter n=1 Tax=Pyruvatibacter sp. TaxID=1981328 RepID=UPI0032EDD5F0